MRLKLIIKKIAICPCFLNHLYTNIQLLIVSLYRLNGSKEDATGDGNIGTPLAAA